MMSNILEILGYIVVFALLVVRFAIYEDKKRMKNLFILVSFVLVGTLLFIVEAVPVALILVLILGILLFNGMLVSYGSRLSFVYIILGAFYLYFSVMHAGVGYKLLAQAMLVGTLSEVSMLKSFKEKFGNATVERRRDIVQLIFGFIIIAGFYFLPIRIAGYAVILTVFLGIILIEYAKVYDKFAISKLIYSLERRNTALGHGALWLAAGSLMAISFLNAPSIVIVFSAIFIGDAFATIVGVSIKTRKLPWNRGKSIGGSAVYFATTAILSYPVAGIYAIPVALLAAFLESLPWTFDDNIAVSFILTAAILIAKAIV